MFSRVARNYITLAPKRTGHLCRNNIKRLAYRGYSSSSRQGAGYTVNPLLRWALTGASISYGIYLVYPFEKKPPKKKSLESEPESEPESQPESESEQGKQEQDQDQEPAQEQELQKKQGDVEVQKREHVQEQQEQGENHDQDNELERESDQEQDKKKDSKADSEPEAKSESNKDQEGKPQQDEGQGSDESLHQSGVEDKDRTSGASSSPVTEPTKGNTVTSTDGHQPNKNLKSDEELQSLAEEKLGEKDKEAHEEGAYNPDTGEINWDCPCLGGMAHGPCGEEFKDAFSCFVYSEADPKGIDCVEKFQSMQDCFRKYPEHYAEQIKDEEEAISGNNQNTDGDRASAKLSTTNSSDDGKTKEKESKPQEEASSSKTEKDAS